MNRKDNLIPMVILLTLGSIVLALGAGLGYAKDIKKLPQDTPEAGQKLDIPSTTKAVRVPRLLKISNISSNVTAQDPATAEAIQFNKPQSKLNLGQNVWLELRSDKRLGKEGVKEVVVVRGIILPFTKWPTKDEVATGYMRTKIVVSENGRIDGTTHTWTNNELQGFTGGVFVQLWDRKGNRLDWDMKVRTFGVNAAGALSGGTSNRTDYWTERPPLEILNQVWAISLVHDHTPQGNVRWDEFMEKSKEVREEVAAWVEVYQTASGGGNAQ